MKFKFDQSLFLFSDLNGSWRSIASLNSYKPCIPRLASAGFLGRAIQSTYKVASKPATTGISSQTKVCIGKDYDQSGN